MRRTLAICGLAVLGLGMGAELALADPPCGRGWRRDEYCGPRHERRADRRDYQRREAYRNERYREERYRDDRYRGERYGYAPRAYGPPPGFYAPNAGPSFTLNVR